MRLHWFYSIHDDEVKLLLSGKDRNSAKDLAGYDPHRLWRARERDAGAYQVPLFLQWVPYGEGEGCGVIPGAAADTFYGVVGCWCTLVMDVSLGSLVVLRVYWL